MPDDTSARLVDLLIAAARLKSLPRTGWLMRGVDAAESVAAHSHGTALAALVLLAGLASSVLLARRVTEPVTALTDAAVAVEAGAFDPQELTPVAERKDELGHLARLFQRMAREVQAREEQLRQQVQRLRIEIDESKRKQQVDEITESDYFQKLRRKAEDLREDSDD